MEYFNIRLLLIHSMINNCMQFIEKIKHRKNRKNKTLEHLTNI